MKGKLGEGREERIPGKNEEKASERRESEREVQGYEGQDKGSVERDGRGKKKSKVKMKK